MMKMMMMMKDENEEEDEEEEEDDDVMMILENEKQKGNEKECQSSYTLTPDRPPLRPEYSLFFFELYTPYNVFTCLLRFSTFSGSFYFSTIFTFAFSRFILFCMFLFVIVFS